jgi:hemerythrin
MRGDSVEREVFAQHRRLDVLFEEALDAFRSEDPRNDAGAALAELREALETHFDQEDRLYYPAIGALRPDLKPKLERFLDAHAQFHHDFERVEALLSQASLDEARAAFEALSRAFKIHEAAEEATLATLERELGTSP